MTPEEILRDLRDIHLPEQADGVAAAGLVLWPVACVVGAALIAVWFAWRRRTAWRREIALHLDRIERIAREGQARSGWTELAVLLRRIAIRVGNRQEVASLTGDAWLEKLDQLFGSTTFLNGPGRGVARYPYGAPMASDRDAPDQAADQLEATVNVLREGLPRLGAMR
ncbi:MAG: DUF4381 domain-containing protein [Geminicoccaceae bacterium]